jgi:3-oxoacyl-[acyl-carrier-protein] synthase III
MQSGLTIKALEAVRGSSIDEPTNKMIYSDLCVKAGEKIFQNTKFKPEDVELVISITDTADYFLPQSGCLIGSKLNLNNPTVINLNGGLAGVNQAISVAAQFFQDSTYQNAIIFTGEAIRPFVSTNNFTDEFYQNGAAALLLTNDNTKGLIAECFQANGRHYNFLQMRAGGSKAPADLERIKRGEHKLEHYEKIKMKPHLQKAFENVLLQCLKTSQIPVDRLDFFVLTNIIPDAYNWQLEVLKRLTDLDDKVHIMNSQWHFSADSVIQLKTALSKNPEKERYVFVFEYELGTQASGIILKI